MKKMNKQELNRALSHIHASGDLKKEVLMMKSKSKTDFRQLAKRAAVCAAVLALLIVFNRTVLGNMMFEGALIILFILPPPFIIPVVANEPAERTEISATLSAMTLLTMVLFAIVSILMKV
jgi:hypothetical protein